MSRSGKQNQGFVNRLRDINLFHNQFDLRSNQWRVKSTGRATLDRYSLCKCLNIEAEEKIPLNKKTPLSQHQATAANSVSHNDLEKAGIDLYNSSKDCDNSGAGTSKNTGITASASTQATDSVTRGAKNKNFAICKVYPKRSRGKVSCDDYLVHTRRARKGRSFNDLYSIPEQSRGLELSIMQSLPDIENMTCSEIRLLQKNKTKKCKIIGRDKDVFREIEIDKNVPQPKKKPIERKILDPIPECQLMENLSPCEITIPSRTKGDINNANMIADKKPCPCPSRLTQSEDCTKVSKRVNTSPPFPNCDVNYLDICDFYLSRSKSQELSENPETDQITIKQKHSRLLKACPRTSFFSPSSPSSSAVEIYKISIKPLTATQLQTFLECAFYNIIALYLSRTSAKPMNPLNMIPINLTQASKLMQTINLVRDCQGLSNIIPLKTYLMDENFNLERNALTRAFREDLTEKTLNSLDLKLDNRIVSKCNGNKSVVIRLLTTPQTCQGYSQKFEQNKGIFQRVKIPEISFIKALPYCQSPDLTCCQFETSIRISRLKTMCKNLCRQQQLLEYLQAKQSPTESIHPTDSQDRHALIPMNSIRRNLINSAGVCGQLHDLFKMAGCKNEYEGRFSAYHLKNINALYNSVANPICRITSGALCKLKVEQIESIKYVRELKGWTKALSNLYGPVLAPLTRKECIKCRFRNSRKEIGEDKKKQSQIKLE